MDLVNKDKNSGMESPPVWATYQHLLDQAEGRRVELTKLERWMNDVETAILYLIYYVSGSSSTSRRRKALLWYTQGRQQCMEILSFRRVSSPLRALQCSQDFTDSNAFKVISTPFGHLQNIL